jgi:EAL domain-containing protein (putative c-di-GMP-specific phosphodiesterase class I)
MQPRESQKTYKTGEVVMRQGDVGDCAYIIEEGEVQILIERADGKSVQVGTRGPGTIVGEMAIVDNAPRVATVVATKDCKMLEITRDDFAQRLKTTDPVIHMIARVILTRYRDTLTRAEILRESHQNPPPEAMERTFAENTDVVESVKIANQFKEALDAGELMLHYQPIVDLNTGKVAGFEALMRWIHKEQGFISPGVFIPIAEKSGLIVEASKWALTEACAALKRISAATGNDKLYMSVNFSSHDFAESDFVSNVIQTTAAAGLEPSRIKLEITERLLIQQPDNAKAALQSCRDKGIGISIDDFGTGYSSLNYLYYFPIDTLKIDQSFIRVMTKEDRSLELVKSIIGLGRNMGMVIVAEGVESFEEAKILSSMGCESAQGYYFAKPMAEKDIVQKLGDWKPQQICA